MPALTNGRYAHSLENAIWAATITASVAPLASYSLDALKSRLAVSRCRFGSGTVTITFTLPAPVTANCFAIPASNLQGAVATVTNGAGLSAAFDAITLPPTRIPITPIVWFEDSTSDTWQLVISGNPDPVTLGGALWLSPTHTLEKNFRYSWHEIHERFGTVAANEYGAEYLVDYGTQARSVRCDFSVNEAGADQLKAWHQDGRFQPSLFWPNPLVPDAYVGRWATDLDLERAHPRWMPISLTFRELAKGLAV